MEELRGIELAVGDLWCLNKSEGWVPPSSKHFPHTNRAKFCIHPLPHFWYQLATTPAVLGSDLTCAVTYHSEVVKL